MDKYYELIQKEREFKEKLVELTNSYEIPAFILKTIFRDMFEQLNVIEENQYQLAKKEAENGQT